MRRTISTILICSLLAGDVLAVGRKKAVYVGGTIESFNKHKKATQGELDLKNEKALIFNVKGQAIEVAYDRITALEYQKTAHYRVGVVTGAVGASAVGIAAVMGVVAVGVSLVVIPVAFLVAPFAKKKNQKRHYLTVAYKDADGKPQALILELGKNIEREARAIISARSGIEVKAIIEGN